MNRPMPKADKSSREFFTSMVPDDPRVTVRPMFGNLAAFVNGNMFRIDGVDADALGKESGSSPAKQVGRAETGEDLEKQVWDQMKTCYDPEIPVNIVDLGLIYDCHLSELDGESHTGEVKMTLTAPGCGMGPAIAADAQNRILSLPGIDDASVEVVWDPPWHQSMISEEGKKTLGIA